MTELDVDGLTSTVDEIRDYAHHLGARELVATMPTLDGEAIISYRAGDWLKVTLVDAHGQRSFHLPPDWSGP